MKKAMKNNVVLILVIALSNTQLAVAQTLTRQVAWLSPANGVLIALLVLIIILLVKAKQNAHKLNKLQQDLNHLSRTDHLTQLFKRHYFEKRLYEVFERHIRKGSGNSVLMMVAVKNQDAVSKKGQTASELVVQKVVKIILERVRNTDLCGRFSDNTFIVLLRDTSIEHAEKLINDLDEKISSTTIEYGNQTIATSCDFGLAAYNKQMDSCIDWIQSADQDLNRVK